MAQHTGDTAAGKAVSIARQKRTRNRPAAFTLIVLTPLIAELALGSTPIRMAWLVILWVPIYGAGVLLIRELVLRRGRGWPSIMVMALGYELLEDGIGLQALTSPHLYGAAEWGLRLFGLNLPYWEANLIYHAVFTVAIPIALTDLLFPRHVGKPYLGRTGAVVAGVVALLGVLVLRVSVPVSQDPGYQAPWSFVVSIAILVVVLAGIALFAIPRPHEHRGSGAVPSPRLLFLAAMGATLFFFALAFPIFGARQPAFTRGAFVVVPMAAAAALATASYILLRRFGASTAWTPRHTLWLIGGALIAHSLGGLVIMARTPIDAIGLVVITALTAVLLSVLDVSVRRRAEGEVA